MATFGFWVFSSAYILDLFRGMGTSHRIYLGLFTFLDLMQVVLFCAWAILITRLSAVFFIGPSASRFRFAAAALVVIIFLESLGAFFPSNFSYEFLARLLVLGALVSVSAWYGVRKYPVNVDKPKSTL